MKKKQTLLTALLTTGLVLTQVTPHHALAQGPGDIPPSVRMEHEGILAYLNRVADRSTPSGKAARHLVEVLKAHMAKEAAFILPPLTLLPALAAGKVTDDMRWALPMTERVAAEQGALRQAHAAITLAIIALQDAAEQEKDDATVGFCRDLAADDLSDVEITEPMVIVIGEVLRQKLPRQ